MLHPQARALLDPVFEEQRRQLGGRDTRCIQQRPRIGIDRDIQPPERDQIRREEVLDRVRARRPLVADQTQPCRLRQRLGLPRVERGAQRAARGGVGPRQRVGHEQRRREDELARRERDALEADETLLTVLRERLGLISADRKSTRLNSSHT